MLQMLIELFVLNPSFLVKYFIAMLMCIFISFGIGLVYKYTHRGLSYEPSFMSTLVVLAPIVACIMFFIQGNLVLSLGLVGSLSIIRFRTPIKDARDMVFLFWSIATGLGAGTDNLGIVIIASIIIAAVFLLMHLIRYGIPVNAEYVLIIRGQAEYPGAEISNIFAVNQIEAYIRSHEVKGDYWERVIELRMAKKDPELIDVLVKALTQIAGVEQVSVLAPQLALPV